MIVYAIITVNGLSKELDQICYSKQEATREKKDLRAMGFEANEIKVIPFENEALAFEYCEAKGIHC